MRLIGHNSAVELRKGSGYRTMEQRFVMKCGGSTLAALPASFFEDLRQLQERGVEAGYRAWRRSGDFGDAWQARHRDRVRERPAQDERSGA